MRIKLDENLPSRLASGLKSFGHDVHTLHDEKLVGLSDNEIWKATQKESRFLITQDLDFSDLRQFVPGTHNGILLVRLRSPQKNRFEQPRHGIIRETRRRKLDGLFCCCHRP